MIKSLAEYYASRRFLFVLGIWLVLGNYFIFSSWLFYFNSGRSFNWGENLMFRGPSYLVYAFLTPAVLLFVEKLRKFSDSFFKHIPSHVWFGLLFTSIHLGVSTFVEYNFRVWFMADQRTFMKVLDVNKFYLLSASFDSFFTYMAITAAAYSLSYYRIFTEEKLRSVRLEAGLINAKLEAIRNKLNPHFLFNSLNSISAMIHIDQEKADEMITRLGDLLRRVTKDDGEKLVTLAGEIEFSEEYLALQRIRFENRLIYNCSIDETLNDFAVPPFVLQPLIENCVKYSLEPYNSVCSIDIAAKIQNQRVVITVEDNGMRLLEEIKEGTGIKLVRDRLEAHYGSDASFSIADKDNGGIINTITLPLESSGRQ